MKHKAQEKIDYNFNKEPVNYSYLSVRAESMDNDSELRRECLDL